MYIEQAAESKQDGSQETKDTEVTETPKSGKSKYHVFKRTTILTEEDIWINYSSQKNYKKYHRI